MPEILDYWETLVRREVKAAHYLSPTDLKNSLPKVLENLAQALEQTDKTAQLEIKVAREHGKERSTFPEYSIEQVISEYRLLRRVIFQVMGNDVATVRERDLIIDAIELGIAEAASEFSGRQYQLREEFISTLVHDLRNPLTSAKTAAQLILRAPERIDAVQVMAARIVDTVDRTDRMIKDLLDSNLVRMGQKLPLEIEEADLRVLTQVAVEEVASIYGDRFVVRAPQRLPGFWDSSILQRAIGNLLVNAIKHGDPIRPVKVLVTVLPGDEAQVQVQVQNFGAPIPPREIEHIFESYRRVTLAKEGKPKGWGIGLYLVRGAIESHGGAIYVTSNQEEGTTFTIILPKDCRAQTSIRAA